LSYQRCFTAKGRVAAFGVDAFERHSPSEASEFGRILRSLVATHKLS
jgi:hypothetical protein